MGSLEDALRKSGLVSKKQAKQARHQKRVHRSEVGRDGLKVEREEKDRAYREQQEKRKDADRHLETERAKKDAAQREPLSSGGPGSEGHASAMSMADRIYRGVLGRTGGPKQYFFTLSGGQIRQVEVNDETFRRLEDGGAGVVLAPVGKGERQNPYAFLIVDRATAVQVGKEAPDCLLELQSERTFGDRR